MRKPVKYIVDKVSIFIYCKFEDMYNVKEKTQTRVKVHSKVKYNILKEKQKEWFLMFYNKLGS